jgi:hypothetical protein
MLKIWSPKSPPMLHTKDIRNPTCNLVVDGVYTLASAPSLAEAIQEFGLQGFGPISTETHCLKVDRGLGNPYAKSPIYWERSSPPKHEIPNAQCEISLIRLIKIFATVLLLWRANLIHWGFLDAF